MNHNRISLAAILCLLATLIGPAQATPAPTAEGPIYRTITRTYHTDSYYLKGLLSKEQTADAAGTPYLETEQTYVLKDVTSGGAGDAASTTATVFPQLTRTDKRFFEGRTVKGVSVRILLSQYPHTLPTHDNSPHYMARHTFPAALTLTLLATLTGPAQATPAPTAEGPSYRTITRTYHTDSYYLKGLLSKEQTADAAGTPYLETEQTYILKDVSRSPAACAQNWLPWRQITLIWARRSAG